ncbi:MAG: acyl carrier protein [Clostridia bacterium]|nr:acyl carrier protein [Clostridia bacterium]
MELQAIQEIISEYLDIDPSTITETTSFKDMEIDSIDMMDIIMNIEDKFDIKIDDTQGLETVGDLIKMIQTK